MPTPTLDVPFPNAVPQAYRFCSSHEKLLKEGVYKYALKIVDVSSRFTVAEPLTSKNAAEVSRALQIIYECVPHR